MKKLANAFIKDESGQGMIEYVIIAALIVIAVIATLITLGGTLKEKFEDVDKGLRSGVK